MEETTKRQGRGSSGGHDFRSFVRETAPCPNCGAARGQHCRSKRGGERASNHRERLELHELWQAQHRRELAAEQQRG